MNHTRQRVLGGLIVSALLLATTVAHGDVRTEARSHFRQGMALIAEGDIDGGVAELQQAYATLPHPNVLYNIGRAYAESGRYAEAIEYFERYLESDPPDRAEVLGFLDALRARIEAIETRAADAPAPAEPSAPAVTPAAVASVEEIEALEESATQIETLAVSAQSEALARRAEQLRTLATALRERRAAARDGAPADAAPEPHPEPATPDADEEDEEESALSLGEGRESDTYEETVVSASRAAQSPLEAPNSTTIVTAQDLRLSGLTNPGEALRRVAGVELMSLSPSDVQLSIRGLNQRVANRTVLLIDGRSVYIDFIGGTLWSLLPLSWEDIERIEIIRGPASALYGADAFTGVVNIITRPMGQYRSWVSSGIGSHGQLRLASTVTRRVDALSFRLGGGYERAELFARAVGPDRVDVHPGAHDPNLGFSRLWFSGEAQLRIADGYNLSAGTALSTGGRAYQGLSRLREVVLDDALFAQTYLQATTAFGLSGRAFWNHFETDVNLVGQREGGIPLAQGGRVHRQSVFDVELVYQNKFDITDGIQNQIIGGVGYRFKEIDWDWIPDIRTQHHFNVFLQDTLRIEEAVQVVVSARLDQHPLLEEPQISPRGSVLVHPTPRQTIRLSAGTAFRSPTFLESYVRIPNTTPIRGVTAFGVGNESLSPERIVSIELSYMMQETDYVSIEANGYYNLVYDQILLSRNSAYRLWDHANDPSAGFAPDLGAYSLGELQFDNDAAGFHQYGGELGVRVYPVSGLDLYANYAIHETSPLGAHALGVRALDARTSAHKVNAGVQYRAPFGLDVSVDFSWVSDQVWVEQVLDTERGGTAFVDFHLPSYVVLNARIGWRLFDDQLELAAVGTNLIQEHRQHPFGQPIDRRFMGTVTFRY